LHPSIQSLHPATTGLPAQEDFGYNNVGNREDITNPVLYACETNNRITTSPNRRSGFQSLTRRREIRSAKYRPGSDDRSGDWGCGVGAVCRRCISNADIAT